ncbi:MAG TPA: hypothetical protein VFC14_08655 [Burkholderiales bacterium]|jgi:hypothetical protein|nr:hypothetical protein [Burkholderiales bacterium]
MKQTIEYLEALAVMALVAMGLTGAAYHLFRDGGWVESAGDSLWSFIINSPLMALSLIVCALILTYLWRHGRSFQRQNAQAATGVFYVMLGAGAYFLGRLILVGTF